VVLTFSDSSKLTASTPSPHDISLKGATVTVLTNLLSEKLANGAIGILLSFTQPGNTYEISDPTLTFFASQFEAWLKSNLKQVQLANFSLGSPSLGNLSPIGGQFFFTGTAPNWVYGITLTTAALIQNTKIFFNANDFSLPTADDAALSFSTKFVLLAIKEFIGKIPSGKPLSGTDWTLFDPSAIGFPVAGAGLALVLAKSFTLKIPNSKYSGEVTSATISISHGAIQMAFNLQVEPTSGYTVDITVTGNCSVVIANGQVSIKPGHFTATHSIHEAWWVTFLDVVTLGVAAIVDGVITAITNSAINDSSIASSFAGALGQIVSGINILPMGSPIFQLLKPVAASVGSKNQVTVFFKK